MQTASEETPNWFDDEDLTPIDVPEFEKLCSQMYHQHRKIKEMEECVKDHNSILNKMKAKVMAYMEDFAKNKYSSNEGTISIQDKFSVQVPKDEEKKQQFFDWLKEKGIFDGTITVHSATLNSLYNSMLEESGDPDFEIPGVGKGTHYKILSIRSK